MAELILTETEKALPYWNDLDDAGLGRAVKKLGIGLLTSELDDDSNKIGFENLMLKAALVGMCCALHERGHTSGRFELEKIQNENGGSMGDWTVQYWSRAAFPEVGITCMHCGLPLVDDEEAKTHTAVCPEHPAVIRAEKAEAERDVLAESLAWGAGKENKSIFDRLPWCDSKQKWIEWAAAEAAKRST